MHSSDLPNLYLAAMDFESLVESSPLANVWTDIDKETDYFPVQFADMVRLLVVDMFGGAYMDSDSFSIHKFPEVPNFIVEGNNRR